MLRLTATFMVLRPPYVAWQGRRQADPELGPISANSGVTLDNLIPIHIFFPSIVALILALIIIDLLMIWLLSPDNCEYKGGGGEGGRR